MDTSSNKNVEFYLNNTINLRLLSPLITAFHSSYPQNGDRIVIIDPVTSLHHHHNLFRSYKTNITHDALLLSFYHLLHYYTNPSREAEYCHEHVCLCVCLCICVLLSLSASISPELHVRYFQPRVHHIWMSDSLPCIIYIMLFRTLSDCC